MEIFRFSLASFVALALAGCDTPRSAGGVSGGRAKLQGSGSTDAFHVGEESFWVGKKMSGSPSIEIVLSEQKAYFYRNGRCAGVSAISTGREGYNTPTGHFHLIQLDDDHRSSQFGDYVSADGKIIKKDVDVEKDPLPPGAHFDGARMPHFMRIVGGTGMHEGFLPGFPDSHGCIRMPGAMAKAFFDAVSVGTPVTIRN